MKKDTAQSLLRMSQSEYDVYASEFSRTRSFFWEELEFIKEYVKHGSSILDIGCGNGRLLDMFRDEEIEYTGIDFSKQLITIAKHERGSKGTFLQGSALSLPFENNSFHTVFSIAVLHHIPSKEHRRQFVSEAYRVLKPDGICVFTVWNTLQLRFAKKHFLQTVKKLCGLSALDFGDMMLSFGKEKRQRFIHSLSKRSIRTLFKKSCFTNISVQEVKRKSGYANFVVVGKK